METAHVAVLISGTVLAITVVQHLFGGGWRLASKLSSLETSLKQSMTDLKADIDERSDRYAKDYGETAAAIRTKMHEIELDMAKHYMRHDSFYQANSENKDNIEAAFKRIDIRLERMEKKIDEKNA